MTSEDMNWRLVTERKVADFVRDGDIMTGLRSYVFDDVKPTFIHPGGRGARVTACRRIRG